MEDFHALYVFTRHWFLPLCSFIGDGGNVELTDEYESALGAVREDLVDSLNAWVVKATKSENLRKFFNPDKQAPTVVFFRKK